MKLTLDEYCGLPADDAWRDELVRGRLVREPSPGARHAWVQARLTGRLVRYAEGHGGFVLVDAGYILVEEPPTVRGPDISYLVPGRLGGLPPPGLLRLAPDLAVEIVSPSNRAGAIADKVRDYLAAGVRLVWVIDPQQRLAFEYRPGAPAASLEADGVLDGSPVLPGCRLRLDTVLGD